MCVCVDYIINVLGVPAADANEVSGRLYRQYGLTVVGLMAENYGVDLDGWHKHVHGTLDYAKLLPRNTSTHRNRVVDGHSGQRFKF